MKFILMAIVAACLLVGSTYKEANSNLTGKIGNGTVEAIVKAKCVFVEKQDQNQLVEKDLKQLKELLLNDQGYHFDRVKKCVFNPELSFYFDGGLVVLVNYHQNQVKFVQDGRAVVVDYDPMADSLNVFMQGMLTKLDNTL